MTHYTATNYFIQARAAEEMMYMEEATLKEFAFDVVDDAIDLVFRRFPEDAVTRARVYRHIARQLQDIAADLMLEDV